MMMMTMTMMTTTKPHSYFVGIMLDELDKELERRGHPFVRYADDAIGFFAYGGGNFAFFCIFVSPICSSNFFDTDASFRTEKLNLSAPMVLRLWESRSPPNIAKRSHEINIQEPFIRSSEGFFDGDFLI